MDLNIWINIRVGILYLLDILIKLILNIGIIRISMILVGARLTSSSIYSID